MEMLRAKNGRIPVAGHRGARGYAPENTMAAFRKAAEVGADAVELDVHLTVDAEIVVIHDDMVDRTTNGHGMVGDLTWSQVRELDAGTWFSPEFAGERVPSLTEVLAWARSAGMPLRIEIKRPTPALGLMPYPGLPARVVGLVREHGLADVAFHSDDHNVMLEMKGIAPEFPTAVILGGAIFIDPLAPVRAARADGVHIHWRYASRELVDLCHEAGVHVFGFGVRDDATELLRTMLDNGTDFVGGDFPDRLRRVVDDWQASRGAAPL